MSSYLLDTTLAASTSVSARFALRRGTACRALRSETHIPKWAQHAAGLSKFTTACARTGCRPRRGQRDAPKTATHYALSKSAAKGFGALCMALRACPLVGRWAQHAAPLPTKGRYPFLLAGIQSTLRSLANLIWTGQRHAVPSAANSNTEAGTACCAPTQSELPTKTPTVDHSQAPFYPKYGRCLPAARGLAAASSRAGR
jgi:hypothetical protein